MTVVVKDNIKQWAAYQNVVHGTAVMNAANDIRRLSNQIVPYKEGTLHDTAEIVRDGMTSAAVWYGRNGPSSAYALVQHVGRREGAKQFSNYTKAGTGPYYLSNPGNTVKGRFAAYVNAANRSMNYDRKHF